MNDSFTNTADNSNNAAGLFVTEVSPGGNTGDSIAEYAAAAFDRAYNQSYQVPFCLSWNNGTGYLNNAVEDDGINFSQKDLVSFVDNHGRMAIAMKKDDLRVVIFELFPNRAIGVFVMNGNRAFDRAIKNILESTSGDLSTPDETDAGFKHVSRLEEILHFMGV